MIRRLTWLPPILAVTFGACLGAGGEVHVPARVHDLVCVSADLPEGFLLQTEGDFSLGDLADLSDDAGARKAVLKAAGLKGGHFNYWKQAVDSPPFDPPLDVVCQAMAFDSGEQAAAFVAGLRANPEDLASTGITWLPSGSRLANEEREGLESLPAGRRAFRVAAEDSQTSVVLYLVVVPFEAYVVSVYAGNRTQAATLAGAVDIQERILARAAEPTASASR